MDKIEFDEIEEKLVKKISRLEGNCGCDYKRNCVISECIQEIRKFFKEEKNVH